MSPRSPPLGRRDVLRTTGAAALAGLSGCLGRSDPPTAWSPNSQSWPLEGYDTRNTRRNVHASPPRDPVVEWRVTDSTAEFETLVVADDAVFVGGTSVRAYETDESLRWKRDRGADAIGFFEGTLYVADNTDGVAALSPEDGSAAWVADFDIRPYGILPTTDRLFVALHNRLVCLDAETGETRWSQWGTNGVGPTGFALGDALYTVQTDSAARRRPREFVERLRDEPPSAEWNTTRGMEFPHAPTVGEEALFVPDEAFGSDTSGGVTAVDVADGTVRWNRELGGDAHAPALIDDAVVAGVHRPGGAYELVALDRRDGVVRWRSEQTHWVGSVAVTADRIVAAGGAVDGGLGGAVSAYDFDGSHEWTVETADDVTAVVPVGNRIYASSRAGEVVALGDR
ncbi:Outer membrane protein assembly factor BamB, contains PQQ-like beta-propeller repeat [Halogranum rubrum]|uniref:Outer membrane protein assembly factor BamB, contains PQQ-like beta-propeller repeat n=1 Tax=Halogranum rubrum TaxID=553466 RepID=A0A1I4CMV4_9EURY|nr:PQQ-binding-like beta-propeller repeat protein [Halogranum rubrum]SFK81406.1 Outer membrane protein assembly factor BamB, contains PQQ-like beta-propeller repeat [Halogranum rubrum]